MVKDADYEEDYDDGGVDGAIDVTPGHSVQITNDMRAKYVNDTAKCMLFGHTRDSILQSLKDSGLTNKQALVIYKSATKMKNDMVASTCVPTKFELIAMYKLILADAVADGKTDTANKVMRSLVELSTSGVETGSYGFDPERPGEYLSNMLAAQASGARIPPAVLAASARAVNAFVESTPEEEKEYIDPVNEEEITDTKSAARACLRLINGGR